MTNNNHIENHSDPFLQTDTERQSNADEMLWSTLGTLYRWRRFITGVTGTAAVLVVVIVLMIDNWYQADTRLLLPARGGTGLVSAAFLDNLPSAAKSLLGGASGDYFRYLAILSSRTVMNSAVDEFDLMTVYDTKESKTPRADAISLLRDNVDFLVDDEYEFLSIVAADTDPQRAADISNYFVRELQRINSELASQSARQFRQFIEQRYYTSEARLDSVLNGIRTFQEEYGVLDLATQGEQFFEYVAQVRIAALEAEAQYETLNSQLGPEHSLVKAAQETAQSANNKYEQALSGQERLLPVAKEELPGIARELIDLERERIVQTTMLEYIRPVLEEARFDEERKVEAVQVVDVAVPPAKKAGPKRSIICIAATLSAFLLSVIFALVYTWWQRNYAYFTQRLHAAAAAPAPAPQPPMPPSREEPASKSVSST